MFVSNNKLLKTCTKKGLPVAAFAVGMALASSQSWAVGGQGQGTADGSVDAGCAVVNGTATFGIGTAAGADVAAFSDAEIRSNEELVEKAKQAMQIPTYVGAEVSYFKNKNKGSRLNVVSTTTSAPITITEPDPCVGGTIDITITPPPVVSASSLKGPSSETEGGVVRGLLEKDFTQAMGLSASQLFLVGFGAGYFNSESEVTGARTLGFNDTKEDGAQLDFYFLYANGPWYTVGSVSGRFGEGDVKSANEKDDYNVYTYTTSLNIGRNTEISKIAGNSLFLDLSGGLAYNKRIAEKYQLNGVSVTNRDFDTMTGNITGTLALQIPGEGFNWRPFIRGSIKQRFHYDNTYDLIDTNLNVVENIDVAPDRTLYRIGGGISGKSLDGKTSLQLRGYYEGNSEIDEIGGTANIIIKLN